MLGRTIIPVGVEVGDQTVTFLHYGMYVTKFDVECHGYLRRHFRKHDVGEFSSPIACGHLSPAHLFYLDVGCADPNHRLDSQFRLIPPASVANRPKLCCVSSVCQPRLDSSNLTTRPASWFAIMLSRR